MINILSKEFEGYDRNEVYNLIKKLDRLFLPSLSARVNLEEYVDKMVKYAEMALAVEKKGNVVGVLAFYANNVQTKVGFITLLGVLPQYQGMGIATKLLNGCITKCRALNMNSLEVKTEIENVNAIRFYEKNGFEERGKLFELNVRKIRFSRRLVNE